MMAADEQPSVPALMLLVVVAGVVASAVGAGLAFLIWAEEPWSGWHMR